MSTPEPRTPTKKEERDAKKRNMSAEEYIQF